MGCETYCGILFIQTNCMLIISVKCKERNILTGVHMCTFYIAYYNLEISLFLSGSSAYCHMKADGPSVFWGFCLFAFVFCCFCFCFVFVCFFVLFIFLGGGGVFLNFWGPFCPGTPSVTNHDRK